MRVKTISADVYDESRAAIRHDGGVGPVPHPVGAHAQGELSLGGKYQLHHGRRTVVCHEALLASLLK
jgi:hypothetical protein